MTPEELRTAIAAGLPVRVLIPGWLVGASTKVTQHQAVDPNGMLVKLGPGDAACFAGVQIEGTLMLDADGTRVTAQKHGGGLVSVPVEGVRIDDRIADTP